MAFIKLCRTNTRPFLSVMNVLYMTLVVTTLDVLCYNYCYLYMQMFGASYIYIYIVLNKKIIII